MAVVKAVIALLCASVIVNAQAQALVVLLLALILTGGEADFSV
jgi:hypothetical protein